MRDKRMSTLLALLHCTICSRFLLSMESWITDAMRWYHKEWMTAWFPSTCDSKEKKKIFETECNFRFFLITTLLLIKEAWKAPTKTNQESEITSMPLLHPRFVSQGTKPFPISPHCLEIAKITRRYSFIYSAYKRHDYWGCVVAVNWPFSARNILKWSANNLCRSSPKLDVSLPRISPKMRNFTLCLLVTIGSLELAVRRGDMRETGASVDLVVVEV